MTRDPRIDAYIADAGDFARPVLQHLRELVHSAIPDADEAIKWRMPHFTVNGKNIAGMAAFKAHCAFTIHGEGRHGDAMGQCGRLTSVSDLPPDEQLVSALQEAVARVSKNGTAAPRKAGRPPRAEIPVPEDFAAALAEVPAAQRTFDGFAPSCRREYLEWITEAKAPATRSRRIAQAAEWIGEGKRRNWKYENC